MAIREQLELELNQADDSIQRMQQAIGRGDGGRELALVKTKIDEAMLWLAAFDKTQEG
jgi:hypothetical protein